MSQLRNQTCYVLVNLLLLVCKPSDTRIALPKITLQQFKTHMILSRGALYDLILRSSIIQSVLVSFENRGGF